MKLDVFYRKSDNVVGVAKIVFNDLQRKYDSVTIGEITKSTSGGTPKRGNSNYYNGNIPWLKSGELNDSLVTSFSETITEEGLQNSSAKLFPKGTLLVAMYGATAGKTGILDFDSTTNQALCGIFPKESILRDYLYWFFRQYRIDYILMSKGGAQPNISQTVIKKTLIPLPPIEIQKEIVFFLNGVKSNRSKLNLIKINIW